MKSKSFSEELSELLASSFGAFEANTGDVSSSDRMSFHQCLRTVMGTNPDWSFLAYRESQTLFEFSESVYSCISEHVGSNSEHWLIRGERAPDEVAETIRMVGTFLDRLVVPRPLLRPGMKRVQGQGKPRAAIAVETAAVASRENVGYGLVLFWAMSASGSDIEMIEWLEKRAGTGIDEKTVDWALAKSFSLTAGKWLRAAEESMVRNFCRALDVDLEKISDDHLEVRLDKVRRWADARVRSVGL